MAHRTFPFLVCLIIYRIRMRMDRPASGRALEVIRMGFRNFGTLLIVFLILMMVFGTHRLRDIGNDLAAAIRNFRKGLQDEEEKNSENRPKPNEDTKEAQQGNKL